MKRSAGLAIMAVVPLLMAAMWMDRQPSIKPYQAPVLMPPSDSVPVSGRELVSQDTELKNPVSPNAESVAQGKDLFTINCAMCHGQNGLGDTPAGKAMKAPSFKDPAVIKVSDAELIAAVTKGKNKMPAYKDKLTDAQIKAVVAYVRALQK